MDIPDVFDTIGLIPRVVHAKCSPGKSGAVSNTRCEEHYSFHGKCSAQTCCDGLNCVVLNFQRVASSGANRCTVQTPIHQLYILKMIVEMSPYQLSKMNQILPTVRFLIFLSLDYFCFIFPWYFAFKKKVC